MKNLTLFIFILSLSFLHAQKAAIIEGEVLVQTIHNDEAIFEIVKDMSAYDVALVKRISPILDIYHLKFDIEKISQEAMLREIGLHSRILVAQNNHKLEKRDTTPNDTQFDNQWQYINNGGSGGVADADIDAELAWDITTGGMTPSGDEIVICVIDDGLNPSHPDFAGNLWSNTQEFPNGIDDDGNGYIDDIDGWNAYDNNDNIDNTFGYSHGTAVACIVGCKGNNNSGVTGVNWDVKLMIVNGGGGEAEALAAYAYPYAMRKLYNDTDGAKGAFVVSTNASWGVNYGQPAQAPLWCSFYDTLGAVGILNAGATINGNVNVEIEGDLPTGCSSDYLITVTNIWRDDNKVTGAGYGATSIDLGAFGEDTWTASQFNNGYDGFGGTSGATPHVAGAIGLLYSAPCNSFASLYASNPAAAALKAKEYIMEGADPNNSLINITVTEARLNLFGALTKLDDDCLKCISFSDTTIAYVSGTDATIYNNTIPTDTNIVDFVLYYREVGSGTWMTTTSSTGYFSLTNLPTNTTYEYQMAVNCTEGTGDFTTIHTFSTTPTSIEDINDIAGISIFPNPNNGSFTVRTDKEYVLRLYNITGMLILQENLDSDFSKINIENLQSGVYIIKLTDTENISYSSKIVKM